MAIIDSLKTIPNLWNASGQPVDYSGLLQGGLTVAGGIYGSNQLSNTVPKIPNVNYNQALSMLKPNQTYSTGNSTMQNGTISIDPSVNKALNTSLGNANSLYKDYGSNNNAFVKARVAPLRDRLALRHSELRRGLSRRGVFGSFANQDITNLDMTGQQEIGNAGALAEQESLNARQGINKDIANIGEMKFTNEIAGLGLSAQTAQHLQELAAQMAGNSANANVSNGANALGATGGKLDIIGNTIGLLGQGSSALSSVPGAGKLASALNPLSAPNSAPITDLSTQAPGSLSGAATLGNGAGATAGTAVGAPGTAVASGLVNGGLQTIGGATLQSAASPGMAAVYEASTTAAGAGGTAATGGATTGAAAGGAQSFAAFATPFAIALGGVALMEALRADKGYTPDAAIAQMVEREGPQGLDNAVKQLMSGGEDYSHLHDQTKKPEDRAATLVRLASKGTIKPESLTSFNGQTLWQQKNPNSGSYGGTKYTGPVWNYPKLVDSIAPAHLTTTKSPKNPGLIKDAIPQLQLVAKYSTDPGVKAQAAIRISELQRGV